MTAPELKTLPLPSLEQTVTALVSAASAVAPADVVTTTRTAGSVFLHQSGPKIQKELERFAATEREAGQSWFSAEWLRGYLSTRTSLLHSTNVSFQINSGFYPLPQVSAGQLSSSTAPRAFTSSKPAVPLLRKLMPEETPLPWANGSVSMAEYVIHNPAPTQFIEVN